jgi:preprotein translocase SecE subunit
MAPVTTRPEEEDEDMLEETAEEGVQSVTPAVSDRRRRRMQARGIEPTTEDDEDTPSREGEVKRSNNRVRRWIDGFITYLHDVRAEIGKVAWLSREETVRLSWIVIIVTVASAAFLGIVSFLFGALTTAVAQPDTSTLAGIACIVLIILVAGGWLLRDRIFPNYQ